jgi:WhiB family redox-sensing transcriptional regulator
MILTNLDQFPNLPDAACSPMTADLFFVTPGERTDPAKQICSLCPEKAACLQWALEHREMEGIWGGTSPLERDRVLNGNTARNNRAMAEARAAEADRRPRQRKPADPIKCQDCGHETVGFSHRCPTCKVEHTRLRKQAYEQAQRKAA